MRSIAESSRFLPWRSGPRYAVVSFGDEGYRSERALAITRVLLSLLVATAAFADPAFESGPSSLMRPLLAANMLIAAAILVIVSRRPSRWDLMIAVVHGIDLAIAATVMLFTHSASPIWLFAGFVLVAAAHRWGLRGAILTASAVIAPLVARFVLVTVTPASVASVWPTDPGGWRTLIGGPAFFVTTAMLLAYVVQVDRQLRAEAHAVGDIVSGVQLRRGFKQTIATVLQRVMRLAHAQRAVLVVREMSTGRAYLCECGGTDSSGAPLRVSPIDASRLGDYMFAADVAAWYAERRPGRGGRVGAVALDWSGSRSDDAPRSFPEPFLAAVGSFRRLMAVAFDVSGDFSGRLFLVDPQVDGDPEAALAFSQRIVGQLGPAIHNVYLLHRLRSRSAASERRRLARELHDGIIQGVLAVEIQLHALSASAAETSESLANELKELGARLREEAAGLRVMMQPWTRLEVAPDQLMNTIASAVDRFQQDTGITARFVTTVGRLDLSPSECHEVARVVQEALMNVRKHSGARNVIVRLTSADGAWRLSIEDDGRGFPQEPLRRVDLRQAHPALWAIRERLGVLGGELTLESQPGRGARIEMDFPLPHHVSH
jgi:signal transduction histidine kinase